MDAAAFHRVRFVEVSRVHVNVGWKGRWTDGTETPIIVVGKGTRNVRVAKHGAPVVFAFVVITPQHRLEQIAPFRVRDPQRLQKGGGTRNDQQTRDAVAPAAAGVDSVGILQRGESVFGGVRQTDLIVIAGDHHHGLGGEMPSQASEDRVETIDAEGAAVVPKVTQKYDAGVVLHGRFVHVVQHLQASVQRAGGAVQIREDHPPVERRKVRQLSRQLFVVAGIVGALLLLLLLLQQPSVEILNGWNVAAVADGIVLVPRWKILLHPPTELRRPALFDCRRASVVARHGDRVPTIPPVFPNDAHGVLAVAVLVTIDHHLVSHPPG